MDRGRNLAVEWEIHTALKGIVRRGERILVLRRSDSDEIGPGSWEFPGGKIRFGEELEEALLREIEEESGLAVEPGELLYATTFHPAPHRQIVLLSYACYWAGGRGDPVGGAPGGPLGHPGGDGGVAAHLHLGRSGALGRLGPAGAGLNCEKG